jgi:hypothetical protein
MSAFFLLLPGDWPAADDHLSRPLLGSRADRPDGMPWVAVAVRDVDGRAGLVSRKDLSDLDAADLVEEATVGLERQRVAWKVTRSRGVPLFRRPTLLRAHLPDVAGAGQTDDLSAEQLLHPAVLLEAGRILGRQELIAVIPKRGWLLVRPGRPGEFPAVTEANSLAADLFGRAGSDRICPYPVFVAGGELTGVNVLEGSRGSLLAGHADPQSWQL